MKGGPRIILCESNSRKNKRHVDSNEGVLEEPMRKMRKSNSKNRRPSPIQNTPAFLNSPCTYPHSLAYTPLVPDTPNTTTSPQSLSLVETETHSQLPLVDTIGQVMIDFRLLGHTFCPVASVEMMTKMNNRRLSTIGVVTEIVPSSFMTKLVIRDSLGQC